MFKLLNIAKGKRSKKTKINKKVEEKNPWCCRRKISYWPSSFHSVCDIQQKNLWTHICSTWENKYLSICASIHWVPFALIHMDSEERELQTLPFFFFPSLINLLNFSQHWNNCMYFLFPFPRQNISHNYYWLNWRHPIQNFQDTFCSHKIWTFVRRSDSILCLNVIRDVQVKSRRRKTNKSTMRTTLPEQ